MMPLTLKSLLLWLFLGISAAQTPVPLPEVSVNVPETPRYALQRELSPAQLLPGQTAEVILTVTHEGSPDTFTLSEQLPAGLVVVDAPDASQEGRFLRWQSSGQGDTKAFRYTVQVECSAPPLLAWQGTLISPVVGQVPAPVGLLERRDLVIEPVSSTVRVNDSSFIELRLTNPSANPVSLSLQATPADNRVSLDSPNASVDLAAGGETTVLFPVTGNRLGASDVQLQTQVDGQDSCPLSVPVMVEAPPSLPPAQVVTTLELQLDTSGIRNLTGLAVIVPLAESVEVTAGTAVRLDESGQVYPLTDPLIDVQRLEIPNPTLLEDTSADPDATTDATTDATFSENADMDSETDVTVYPKAAVFVIEEDLGTVQTLRFDVSHQGAFQFDPTLASLVGLTPEPFVITGRQDASERYLRAVPDTRSRPVMVAREGAIILSPAENTLIRSGNTSTIRVDVPLGGEVRLFLGEGDTRLEIDPERIGQQVLDRNVNRQTLDYIAVPLELGSNLITVEHTSADGTLSSDDLTVIVSGSAASLELRPLSTLVADSAEPLRFALDVRDARGNIPTDGTVTLEIVGADPRTADAEPQQLGFQLRYQDGRALLELVPVSEPRTLTFRASFEPGVSGSVENPILETNVVIDSNVRRWLVNGVGSVGVAVDDDFSVDAGASLFARGKLFEDYLLTFGVNYPFEPLGRFGDPYEPFPVPGASGELSQDAESRDGVFVRLERNLSFVQYGEFDTDLNTTLVNLDRSYTGVSATYRRFAGGLFARGFAAYIPVGQTVNDLAIPGDGTTFYVLPGAPIEPGSLAVQVIKRSAFDPNVSEDEADRLIQDGDPLVGDLVELRDYTIDETLGFLRLSRPLPPIDSEGNRYFLQVSYRREASSNTRDWQAGGAVGYEHRLSETESATVSVSGYRETTETREVTVVGARGELDSDGLEADVEVALGSETRQVNTSTNDDADDVETDSSGLGLATGVRYSSDTVDAEVRYQYLADDFRSSEVTRASQTGHSLDGQLEVLLARYLGVGFEAMWKDSPGTIERNREYAADVYGLFIEDGDFGIANRLEAEAGVGIRNDVPRLRFGVTFSDLVGVDGIRAEILHLQSLGDEPSVSELSLSYEIIENLSLELTDRLEWGVDNALLIGLVSRFDNGDLFGSAANFGSSQLRAQYELPRGISNTGGTVRLGASTSYAATDTVSLEGSFDQILDLDDTDDSDDADDTNDLTSTTGDATIIAAALRFDDRDLDAQLRYEVRFDETSTKHVGNAGVNVALSNRLFASLTADVIADDSRDPDFGLRVSAAAAYRGEVVNLLTNNHLDTGAFDVAGGTVLEGDWRVDVPLDELLDLDPNLTVRAGYAYRYREAGTLDDDSNNLTDDNDSGYRDMISLGVTVEPWRGGNLTGYGRRFHDYDRDITAWGFTVEASQRVACGSYGVLAYSFDDIPDPVFSQEGLQVRLDVVADEQWRCGGGDIHGLAFIDANGDGIRQVANDETNIEENPENAEDTLAGIILRLYDADGRLITSTESDEDGRYHFADVDVNRDHIVTAVLPRGYRFSPLEQGDDPEVDSNINPDTGETPPFRVGRLRDTQHLDVGFIPVEIQPREAQP
jgi:hypothetical protein